MTIIFPMYHEVIRASPKAEDNPLGQDFLRVKVEQISWVFKSNPKCSWNIIACDDGCDQGSADVCKKIVAEEKWDNVEVIHLQEAIDQKIPLFSSIKTTKDSRKGGAVVYAMHYAMTKTKEMAGGKRHLLTYTDADLSTDISLTATLAHKILVEGNQFAQGARYGYPGSYLILEDGARPHPIGQYKNGNILHMSFRHYSRMHLLPDLKKIYDTNVSMKCWQVADFKDLLVKIKTWGPAFDMQLLLEGALYYRKKSGKSIDDVIGIMPFPFIEDFSLSNFTLMIPTRTHRRLLMLESTRKFVTFMTTLCPSLSERKRSMGWTRRSSGQTTT